MRKEITNKSNTHQSRKTQSNLAQLILTKVNKPSEDIFLDANLDNYNQKETILDMVNKMPYRKFISKQIRIYKKRFRAAYYDEMFRLTGIRRNKEQPHLKPNIFGRYTLEVIYSNFPDGIISYFNENNKADEYGHRLYKHFQLLNNLGETKLALIIEDAIKVMKQANNWTHFIRLWRQENRAVYQGTLFEEEKRG